MIPPTEPTWHYIAQHLRDDVRCLALRGAPEGVDIAFALKQIAGRQAEATKLPTWHDVERLIFPPHLSMEQCSSEATALYKASLLSGDSFVDLTGGYGVDCYFIATHFRHAVYVERQPALCDIARYNFSLLGREIAVVNGDAAAYLSQMGQVDCIFLDPARRDTVGRKVVAIADCEPDVAAMEEELLEKGARVCVKLSPMLDLMQCLRALRSIEAVHIVSVNNECKELLLLLTKKPAPLTIHCVNIGQSTFSFTPEEESCAACTYADQPRRYLYEPNASIMKAGAFRAVAVRFALEKLHPNSHLYTSDTLHTDFPGRAFLVEQSYSFSKQDLKAVASLRQANIATRNFPMTVAALRKRLKLGEGGTAYLFATTLANEEKTLLLCRKVNSPR